MLFKLVNENNNTITLSNGKTNCTLRILEENIFNVKITDSSSIKHPTWTVTPGDTPLPYEGLSRYENKYFLLPDYSIHHKNNSLIVSTASMKLVIDLANLHLNWYQKDENESFIPIMNDRKTQAYKHQISDHHDYCHYINRDLNEVYYGLGEKTGDINKAGERYRMGNIDAMGYNAKNTDPLYKHVPFYITLNEKTKQSFGIYYDDYQDSVFDFGKELDNYHGLYRYFQTKSDFLDYYVMGGKSIKEISQTFSWLTGRPTRFPEWSASYSGSTMQYTDMPNSEYHLYNFLNNCQENDFTVKSFHLSSGYTSIENKRHVFNWNYEKFPDPKEFGETFSEKGVQVVANIKPTLMLGHPLLDEVLAFDGFIKDENGDPLLIQFWDDKGYYLDFTNYKTIDWWKYQIKTKLLDNNILCTWNDNNEFEIWNPKAKVNGFGNEDSFVKYRAIMPLLMMKASREIQMAYTDSEYPYIISRSGCAGMSKYVQTWTGDNYTSWNTLKYNNKMAIGLSLSGVHNFGHDIGGFSGPKPDPELFLRWVQCGVFYPRFSIHSWNADGSVNEPWMHTDVLPEIKSAMHLHERLTPYISDLQNESHQNYEPIIRPTFYEFQNDCNTFKNEDSFMLGSKLLIHPIVSPGVKTVDVYLPENEAGWLNFFDNSYHTGGQTISVKCSLSNIPVFIQNGSSIRMYDNDLNTIENITYIKS